ncbi:MAG: hypothetical protein K1X81_00155 [Bacteroidia bacterium]|nr:hypothetical protein [Bacteroidia bacterium]
MRKLLYVFIGMAIALGAMVLYSFKTEKASEASYAIIRSSEDQGIDFIFIYYGDGTMESAETILNIKIGENIAKGKTPVRIALAKSLEYLSKKGYKLISESQAITTSTSGGTNKTSSSFTLVKQN